MPADGGDLLETPFWRFSLTVYAATGVAEECLRLQDENGVDVNVLLYAAWLGSMKSVAIGFHDVMDMRRAVETCNQALIGPLRTIRRSLSATSLPESARKIAYAAVAKAELSAEQVAEWILYSGPWKDMPRAGAGRSTERVLRNCRNVILCFDSDCEHDASHLAEACANLAPDVLLGDKSSRSGDPV